MRLKLLLVALALSVFAAAPLVAGAIPPYKILPTGTKVRVVCPTNGVSTATTLGEGATGRYLISCAIERCCICYTGPTTCGDDTTLAWCAEPGKELEIQAYAKAFACWSAGGAGVGQALPIIPQ